MSVKVLERGLHDIMKAERELRRIAEIENHKLREVLTELAYRLAGAALEEIRQQNPQAPGNWGADAWRAFFAEQLRERQCWAQPELLQKRVIALQEVRDEMRGELGELEDRLVESLAEIKHLQALTPGDNGSGPKTAVEAEVEKPMIWPEIPHKPPMRFISRLGTGDRWRREALALYLIATRGWSLRLEILGIVGGMTNVKPNSGSLKRIFVEGLAAKGLAESAVLSMNLSKGQARIAVLRLTEEGKTLCRMLGWEPVESEWERLIRLHDGDRQEAHTATVLSFAYHARQRGWRAELLPSVEETNAQPDVLVEKDNERVFLEVELGKDKPTKWRNLAELQGFVALCAATAEKRAHLVAECKLDRLSGRATDIETLIQASKPPGPLWAETW